MLRLTLDLVDANTGEVSEVGQMTITNLGTMRDATIADYRARLTGDGVMRDAETKIERYERSRGAWMLCHVALQGLAMNHLEQRLRETIAKARQNADSAASMRAVCSTPEVDDR